MKAVGKPAKQSPEAGPKGQPLRGQETEGQEACHHDNLPSTETMERISRQELADNLDAVLDRVLRENIGLVIIDAGKDDLVLCPSAWLDPFHTEDFGSVINCALRYAMHAEDKESEAVVRYLRHRCGILDEKTLSVAVADLDRELKQPSPSLKNPQVWQELQGMFRKQLAELRADLSEDAERQESLAKHDKP